MKKICLYILPVAVALALVAACAGKKGAPTKVADTTSDIRRLLDSSKEAAYAAMKEKDRGDVKELTRKGISSAERCLMRAPENEGCYYWRAINTGLYYRVKIIGYQTGIKRMIDDCNQVIKINPKYDYAGAYRVLGQVYTQLPQTGARPDSITRDLPLAEDYLKKAVLLAPDYPENHLALAETYFEEKKFADALDALSRSKGLAPLWKHDLSYDDWNEQMQGLEKKIAKKK